MTPRLLLVAVLCSLRGLGWRGQSVTGYGRPGVEVIGAVAHLRPPELGIVFGGLARGEAQWGHEEQTRCLSLTNYCPLKLRVNDRSDA